MKSVKETSRLPGMQCNWGGLHVMPSKELYVHACGARLKRLQQVGVQDGRAGFS